MADADHRRCGGRRAQGEGPVEIPSGTAALMFRSASWQLSFGYPCFHATTYPSCPSAFCLFSELWASSYQSSAVSGERMTSTLGIWMMVTHGPLNARGSGIPCAKRIRVRMRQSRRRSSTPSTLPHECSLAACAVETESQHFPLVLRRLIAAGGTPCRAYIPGPWRPSNSLGSCWTPGIGTRRGDSAFLSG